MPCHLFEPGIVRENLSNMSLVLRIGSFERHVSGTAIHQEATACQEQNSTDGELPLPRKSHTSITTKKDRFRWSHRSKGIGSPSIFIFIRVIRGQTSSNCIAY